jgi:hypothetical protein
MAAWHRRKSRLTKLTVSEARPQNLEFAGFGLSRVFQKRSAKSIYDLPKCLILEGALLRYAYFKSIFLARQEILKRNTRLQQCNW